MRRLLFFLLFTLSFGLGLLFNHISHLRDVYRSVCDLTEDHFFRDDERLGRWLNRCHSRAAHVSIWTTVPQLLGEIQNLLNEMSVSHFQVYNPVEDKKMWRGEAVDTGIRSRYVEDHLVIYKVLEGSGAARAGVVAGDDILRIAGTEQVTPWGAEHRSGRYALERHGRAFSVEVEAQTLVANEEPRVHRLNASTALVEIPSFRSEFFQPRAWRKLVDEFKTYPRLIVDVRDNPGGNFVAMLRALSTFRCGDSAVGVLFQPRRSLGGTSTLADNTSDRDQIEELAKFRNLRLRTFSDYGCFDGPVTLLINSDTASVAEIFAYGFFGRKASRVWGQPSAGDVLLAVWYDLPQLGAGYSLSIPEAFFVTPENTELEGQGVRPQRELYYDLKRALAGADNWLEESLR